MAAGSIPSGACSLPCFVKGSQHHIGNTPNSVLLDSPPRQECLAGCYPGPTNCNARIQQLIRILTIFLPEQALLQRVRNVSTPQVLNVGVRVSTLQLADGEVRTLIYEEGREIITTSTEALRVTRNSSCTWFLTFNRVSSRGRRSTTILIANQPLNESFLISNLPYFAGVFQRYFSYSVVPSRKLFVGFFSGLVISFSFHVFALFLSFLTWSFLDGARQNAVR